MSETTPTSQSKEWKKALSSKVFDEKQIMELAARPDQELQDLIAANSIEIRKRTDELHENPAYQKVALAKKDLEAGLKDTLLSTKVALALATRILKDRAAGTEA